MQQTTRSGQVLLPHLWVQLTHVRTTRASSTVLHREGAGPAFWIVALGEGWSQLFCSQAPEVGSPPITGNGGACFPYSYHPMASSRGARGSSPAFTPTGLADLSSLPPTKSTLVTCSCEVLCSAVCCCRWGQDQFSHPGEPLEPTLSPVTGGKEQGEGGHFIPHSCYHMASEGRINPLALTVPLPANLYLCHRASSSVLLSLVLPLVGANAPLP